MLLFTIHCSLFTENHLNRIFKKTEAMPKQDYEEQKQNDQQSVNTKTWQDSTTSKDESKDKGKDKDKNAGQNVQKQAVSEVIPQLTADEQKAQDEKRNSPEFEQGLKEILPQGNAPKTDDQKDPGNLNAMIQEWQKATPKVKAEDKNDTGLPDELKTSAEKMSGLSLSDVRVHFNSTEPAKQGALAYTQGSDIFVGPNEEKHLAHELAHVVQQKQGTVKPAIQGEAINNDAGLEQEADKMADEAAKDTGKDKGKDTLKDKQASGNVIQRKVLITGSTPMTLKEVEECNQSDAIKEILRGWVNDGTTDGREFKDIVGAIKAAQELLKDTTYKGTLKSLATLLNQGLSGAGLFTDEFLLSVLTGPFEANWYKAKACLTMDAWPEAALAGVPVATPVPAHENSMDLMAALVEMRGRVWDGFAKATLPKIKDAVTAKQATLPALENPAVQDKNLKIDEAVGSNSVTSDIDLSLKGENTEIGVALINSEFKKHFKVPYEPGTLFDINVYSSDWMFGGTEIEGEAGVATYKPNAEAEPKSELAKQDRDDANEIWSMVKIRRNMTPQEWETYKTESLAAITASPDQVASTTKLYGKVEQEYATFKAAVAQKLVDMKTDLDNGEAALLKGNKSAFEGGHYEEEARSMAASNALYESAILEVKTLRLQIKQLNLDKAAPADIDAASAELANKIAKALTFANEVYASEGAVLHTVYGKQGASKKMGKLNDPKNQAETSAFVKKGEVKAVKYDLKPEQYLQSVNENVGDSLHSLNHYAENPEYAAYRAGKYLDRLCEAANLLLGEEEAKKVANFADLLEIGTKSVKEKSGAAGEDPMAVKNESSFFSKFNELSKVNEIKAKTIAFGASVAGKHKNKTKRLKKDEQQ